MGDLDSRLVILESQLERLQTEYSKLYTICEDVFYHLIAGYGDRTELVEHLRLLLFHNGRR